MRTPSFNPTEEPPRAQVARSSTVSLEAGVVGAILLKTKFFDAARALKPDDFSDPRLKFIWEALQNLDYAGEPLSPILLVSQLQAAGKLETAGGVAFISALTDEPPLASQLPAIVARIKKSAALRQAESDARILLELLKRNDLERAKDFAEAVLRQLGIAENPLSAADGGLNIITAAELETMAIREIQWVVPKILPGGLCLLAGRPKKGKSWLSLNIAVATTTGGCALGKQDLRLESAKVLYLALEDKFKRLKDRLHTILGDSPFPEDLILADEWPRLDQGGLKSLKAFLERHRCKLVVIDSFAKVKPSRQKHMEHYDFEMLWGGKLQQLAHEFECCILLIYHTRKAEADDPLDEVIGSTGLTGAVDAVLILRRGRGKSDGTLLVTGRDVEEQRLALKFNPGDGLWELIGTETEAAMSRQRQDLLHLLKEVGPLTPKEAAEIMGKSREMIKKLLLRMAADGLVKRVEGKYVL